MPRKKVYKLFMTARTAHFVLAVHTERNALCSEQWLQITDAREVEEK